MATEEQNRRRARWRWLRAGQNQFMPYPDDEIDIYDRYMINGFLFFVTCTPSDFQSELNTDINEVFLNPLEFATTAIYTDADNNSFPINGIYDDPYQEVIPETEIGIQSQGPRFKVNLCDLVNPVRPGDKIKICVCNKSQRFTIIKSEPDGVGLTDLILHRVSMT